VSFPRSGNNWTVNLLTDLIKNGAIIDDESNTQQNRTLIYDAHTITEKNDLLALPNFSGILKSHYFDLDVKNPIIYIYRDASDVIPSYLRFHKFQGFKGYEPPYPWRMIHFFLKDLMNHWKIALQLHQQKSNQILFISYEGLHLDSMKTLQELARFIRVIKISDKEITKIIENNNFKSMQKRYAPWTQEINGEVFLKYGSIGAGSQNLTKLQSIYIKAISSSIYSKMKKIEMAQNLSLLR
jgi:hypothetical protein